MNTEYNFKVCDCCNVELGQSDFTIFNEHDAQLFICEDCYTITK